jgi:hypothetical protein
MTAMIIARTTDTSMPERASLNIRKPNFCSCQSYTHGLAKIGEPAIPP